MTEEEKVADLIYRGFFSSYLNALCKSKSCENCKLFTISKRRNMTCSELVNFKDDATK